MPKHQSHSAPGFERASGIPPREGRGGSGPAARRPLQGEIGFVGLGHMGAAMAASLVASGRRVVAYVRRPDQVGKLEAPGLRPTTDIDDLLDCELVISMLPDDAAVREIVFGRKEIGLDGLAGGLMPGAIHLSMSTISSAAASLLASEHARNGQGYVAAPGFGNPDAAKARQLFIVAAGAPADDRHRTRLCRTRLDGARAYRARGGGTLPSAFGPCRSSNRWHGRSSQAILSSGADGITHR